MPLDSFLITTPSPSSLAAESSANAIPRFRFTPADLDTAETATPETGKPIADIDAFLAAFGTSGMASGEERQTGGGGSDDDDADQNEAGPLPDTGALGGPGDAAGGGSNPGGGGPGANPGGRPLSPLPLGPGQGQPPAPPPVNPLVPAPPVQPPANLVNPFKGGAGNSYGPGSSSSTTTQGPTSNVDQAGGPDGTGPGQGGGPTSSPANGIQPAVKPPAHNSSGGGGGNSWGGFGFGSSSSSSSSSSSLGHGSLAGGLPFSGIGPSLAGGALASIEVRTLVDKFRSGAGGGGNSGAGNNPVDQPMPPANNESGRSPAQPPAPVPVPPASPIAAWNVATLRAQDMLKHALSHRDENIRMLGQLTTQKNVLLGQIANEEAVNKLNEAGLAAERTYLSAHRKLMSQHLTAANETQHQIELLTQARGIVNAARGEAQARLDEASRLGREAVAVMKADKTQANEQINILGKQTAIINTQNKIIAGEEAAAQGITAAISNAKSAALSTSAIISRLQTHVQQHEANQARLEQHIARATKFIADKSKALADLGKTLTLWEQRDAQALATYRSALDLLQKLGAPTGSGSHHDADGDVHMGSVGSMKLSVADPTAAQVDETQAALPDAHHDSAPALAVPADPSGTPPDHADGTPVPDASPAASTTGTTGTPDTANTAGTPDTAAAQTSPQTDSPSVPRPAAPTVTTDAAGARHLTLQIALTHPDAHPDAHPGSPAEIPDADADAAAQMLPVVRALIAAWMHTLPASTVMQIERIDIVKAHDGVPLKLAIEFLLRSEPAAGTDEVVTADAVAVLQTAIQSVMENWDKDPDHAVPPAAFDVPLHSGTGDMTMADAVMLAMDFLPRPEAGDAADISHRSHDLDAIQGILANWSDDMAPDFAATVFDFDMIDLTNDGDVALQLLLDTMPDDFDLAELTALQNLIEAYLAQDAPHPDHPAHPDATLHQALRVVGVAEHGGLG